MSTINFFVHAYKALILLTKRSIRYTTVLLSFMHMVEAVWVRSNTFCACLEGALFVVVSIHVDKQSRGRKHVMIAENRELLL